MIYQKLISKADDFEIKSEKLSVLNFFMIIYHYLDYHSDDEVVDVFKRSQIGNYDIAWEFVEKSYDIIDSFFTNQLDDFHRTDFRFMIADDSDQRDLFMWKVMTIAQFEFYYKNKHFPYEMYRGGSILRY